MLILSAPGRIFLAESFEFAHHHENRLARAAAVVGLVVGVIPEGHDAVADEFVNRPVGFEHAREHPVEKSVQKFRDALGAESFRNGREAADVGEHERQFLRVAFRVDAQLSVHDLSTMFFDM